VKLNSWLQYIQSIHPAEIELGLDRLRQVAARLELSKPAPIVITIAGTNGKGSCLACLDQLLLAKGHRTGSCTSPHLHRFNERIRLAGEPVSDQQICQQFEAIESARQEISLSYFEFTTLAALRLLQHEALDVALLEVGLGGRLDAVNIIDADISVITSIDLDHMEWLGHSRDEIAVEKAGIARRDRPLVCGDPEPPKTVFSEANRIAAALYQSGIDFTYQLNETSNSWNWQGKDSAGQAVAHTDLCRPGIDLINAATALQVLTLLPLDYASTEISGAMKHVKLAGRFETYQDPNCNTHVILDVAHNPAAARLLAEKLRRFCRLNNAQRVVAVIAMMSDKDIKAVSLALESTIDIWYIAQFEEPRCMPASELAAQLSINRENTSVSVFGQVSDAYQAACEIAEPNDVILVTGSFLTVAAVREPLQKELDS